MLTAADELSRGDHETRLLAEHAPDHKYYRTVAVAPIFSRGWDLAVPASTPIAKHLTVPIPGIKVDNVMGKEIFLK